MVTRRRRSRLPASIQDELIKHFVAGATARSAAALAGVNRHTARLYFHKLREVIAEHLAGEAPELMAKQGGTRLRLYDHDWDRHQQERFALLADFARAVARADGGVHHHLQPIMRLADGRFDRAVRSTNALGHDLGMTIVAEGIEDEAMAEAVDAWGCDCAQGVFYAKPMPEPDFERWLEAGRA